MFEIKMWGYVKVGTDAGLVPGGDACVRGGAVHVGINLTHNP